MIGRKYEMMPASRFTEGSIFILLVVVFNYFTNVATCKPIIERQLKDEKAVKNIDIDYMTDRVIVEFDPSIITKEFNSPLSPLSPSFSYIF